MQLLVIFIKSIILYAEPRSASTRGLHGNSQSMQAMASLSDELLLALRTRTMSEQEISYGSGVV